MHMKSLLSAGVAALALGLAATTAQAAPVGGLAAAVDRDSDRGGAVEKVTWYGDHYYYRPYFRYGHYRPFYGYRYNRPFDGHRYWRYPRYDYRYY